MIAGVGYVDTYVVGHCADCGGAFYVAPGRELYCEDCLPEGYVLSAPLQRAEEYPEDDPDLSLDIEPDDDSDA